MTEQEWREEFSRILRVKMNEKNITQKELADRSGVNEKTISRYINRTRTPNAYIADKLIHTINKYNT